MLVIGCDIQHAAQFIYLSTQWLKLSIGQERVHVKTSGLVQAHHFFQSPDDFVSLLTCQTICHTKLDVTGYCNQERNLVHKHTSVQQYYESFINTVEVIKHCGGDIGTDQSLVTEALGGRDQAIASDAIIADAKQSAKEKYLSCVVILGANKTHCGRLLEDLENSFMQGIDKFLKMMMKAYNILVNWKQNSQNYP
jgi:hypothetical protein